MPALSLRPYSAAVPPPARAGTSPPGTPGPGWLPDTGCGGAPDSGCGCRPGAGCECPPGPGRECPPAQARPLPDPAAVRLCPVPDNAPPYDPPRSPAGHRPARASQAGPGGAPAPGDAPAPGGATAAGRARGGTVARPGSGPDASRQGGSGQGGSGSGGGDEPPPDGWPSHFAQVLAETLAGSRPPRQIVPWTTDRARSRIQRLGAQLSGQQPRVRRVRTCQPAPGVLEMTVVAGFGPRVRALAVRLERAGPEPARPGRPAREARWLCTDLEAG